MPPDPSMLDRLGAYVAIREQDRHNRVEAVLSAMTPRERLLVREIAVMANVLAMQRAGVREDPGPDSAVVYATIAAALSFTDLYPTVNQLLERTR